MTDLRVGPDGRERCAWVGDDPEYVRYHDEEWGRPLHGDRALFEKMSLEGFQAGLSWITILRKRPAFRSAFADFVPSVVAAFDDTDIARLLGDAGIVRNRAKIDATISNARLVQAMARASSTPCCGRSPPTSRRPVPSRLPRFRRRPPSRTPPARRCAPGASASWVRPLSTRSCSRRGWSTTTSPGVGAPERDAQRPAS